jgi:hypothetical protein
MTKPKPKPAALVPPESPRTTRAFLDGVESGVARLLMEDEHGEWRTFHLPAAALPASAKEGSWIELGIRSIPPPEPAARALREQLGRSDRGGNFSL